MSKQCEEHESFCVLESWGNAVKSKVRADVIAHYCEGATLWPTLSNVLRKEHAGESKRHIEEYFVTFLAKIDGVGPVEWNEKCAQPIDENHCMWSGIYTFHLIQGAVRARFSYLVKKVDGEWKLMHHHSSQMPEA